MNYTSTYIYYALLAFCCAYAFAAGGAPERIGAAVLAIGSVLSFALASTSPVRFQSVEYGIVVVDIPVFIAYCVLASRADRFWPIWAAALIGVGALGHLGRWYVGSDISRWVYAVSITIWSYPTIAVIVTGTRSHQRRVARLGSDRSWTSSASDLTSRPAPR